jgi:plastocyanin
VAAGKKIMHYDEVVLAVAVSTALGCGGGSSTGTPTSPGAPNMPPVATTTITITAAGVNPQVVTVPAGSRVTFINNNSRSHEMHSDPHPDHGDCPPINEVGFIAAGQTRLTGPLTAVRTCGYHDHNLPDDGSLRGQIIVQ